MEKFSLNLNSNLNNVNLRNRDKYGDFLKDYSEFHAYCVARYNYRYNSSEDRWLEENLRIDTDAFGRSCWRQEFDSAQEFADFWAPRLFQRYVQRVVDTYHLCITLKHRYNYLRFLMYEGRKYLSRDQKVWVIEETSKACQEEIDRNRRR